MDPKGFELFPVIPKVLLLVVAPNVPEVELKGEDVTPKELFPVVPKLLFGVDPKLVFPNILFELLATLDDGCLR